MNLWYIIQYLISIFIPVIVLAIAIWYLLRQARAIIRALHGLSEDYQLNDLLFRRILPQFIEQLLTPTYIPLREATGLGIDHWARWLGGPARLIIYDGVAIYLEQFGMFSRVLGPGLPMPDLDRYETIKSVIDLRPQTIERESIRAWAKDGIQVTYSMRAEIQIASSEEARRRAVVLPCDEEARNLVYPFDADAVQLAVESTTVANNQESESLEERDWILGSTGKIIGSLNSHMSRYSINELLFQDENSPQFFSFTVSEELFQSIDANLNRSGIQLLSLQAKQFSPVDQGISDGLFGFWSAQRERSNAIRRGEDDARRIRANQRAQTITQQELLDSMLENLSEINDGIPPGADLEGFSETAILLMTQTLDRNISDPILKTYLAREMLETFNILREQLGI